jgi:2',3'-cyclic-nucleotide 2'-phosphodiesterase (5'-nucleotidase family)
LFFDSGDSLHGTYPAVATRGQALVPVLNRLGLEAMTIHWDAAYGLEALKARGTELNYSILALNARAAAVGRSPFPGTLVKEAGGLRVGVIGMASNLLGGKFSPGLEADLSREAVLTAIAGLRDHEKVDLVVLLSHLGFPQDLQLAAETPGLDVVLSGHTHNRVTAPAHSGGALVIQSGSHGAFLGRLDLVVEGGRVVDYSHRLIEVEAEIDPDPEMAALVAEALAPFAGQLDEVVGEARGTFDRGATMETTLDNLLLEMLRFSTGAPLAFSNGWRYGAPILPGPITQNDLYNLIPVNPPVSTVELAGAELVEMLEENLESTFARDPYRQRGGYVKRALGLRAYVKVENPAGQRLQALFVGDEEVQPDHLYPAAFVTEQGVPAKYGQDRREGPERAVDALRRYLAQSGPVTPTLRGTFTLV